MGASQNRVFDVCDGIIGGAGASTRGVGVVCNGIGFAAAEYALPVALP